MKKTGAFSYLPKRDYSFISLKVLTKEAQIYNFLGGFDSKTIVAIFGQLFRILVNFLF